MISIQQKEYSSKEIPVNIKADKAEISNLKDIDLIAQAKTIVEVNEFLAENNIYRGNADPLKGLNVAQAINEVRVGNYYALIIGVDQYTGDWKQLENAVGDAKGVVEMLNEKYKFDEIITLYDKRSYSRSNLF